MFISHMRLPLVPYIRESALFKPSAQLQCSEEITVSRSSCAVEKVKIAHRLIGPDEYDDAARRWPQCCPLVMLGDLRSGRQLLADAPADSAETLASLATSPRGCAAMESVAVHLEGLLAGLEHAPDSPCEC